MKTSAERPRRYATADQVSTGERWRGHHSIRGTVALLTDSTEVTIPPELFERDMARAPDIAGDIRAHSGTCGFTNPRRRGAHSASHRETPMTAAYDEQTTEEDSVATTDGSGLPSFSPPKPGVILHNDESVSIDQAFVGTAVKFPGGRVVAELRKTPDHILGDDPVYRNYNDVDQAERQLQALFNSDNVWFEWDA